MVGISPQEYARRKKEAAKVKRCKDCRQAEPHAHFSGRSKVCNRCRAEKYGRIK